MKTALLPRVSGFLVPTVIRYVFLPVACVLVVFLISAFSETPADIAVSFTVVVSLIVFVGSSGSSQQVRKHLDN